MNPYVEVRAELRSLGAAFPVNELAYLALTAKIEGPVRDKLAARLNQRLRGRCYVAREWPIRTDLAILDCEEVEAHGKACPPRLVLEAKAMYSYDAIPTRTASTSFERHFLPQLTADLEKVLRVVSDRTQVCGLLLVTHPTAAIPRHLTGLVKYSGMINTRLRKLGPERLWREMRGHVVPELKKMGAVVEGSWDAGTAFGVPCTIGYWLVRSGVQHRGTAGRARSRAMLRRSRAGAAPG